MRPTQIIRQAARHFGYEFIATNKYDTCRTVKVYSDPATDNAYIATIRREMNSAGYVEGEDSFQIKIVARKAFGFQRGYNSIIVRISPKIQPL